MSTARINLASLENANARFERFIARYEAVGPDEPDYDLFLAAVAKGYEFTYGQAVNVIRRYVGAYALSPGAAGQMSLPDIMRVAARDGIIASPEEWFDFRDRRNETAHEYFDQAAIERMVAAAPQLREAVSRLTTALRDRAI